MRHRRRRVKCDEGQPECQRCIKAGRTCEGYARSNTPGSSADNALRFVVYSSTAKVGAPSKPNTGASTPISRTPSPGSQLPLHPDFDHAERRALSYFQDRAAWDLAGALQPIFWLDGVLPIVQHEPSVKHALVALSTMHEHFTRSGRMSPNTNSNKLDFALNHYGWAIREVVHMNQGRQEHSFDCALITCGLFSAFESLQGHYHSAFSHAVSGIKILAESQQNPLSILRSNDRSMYIARTELTRFFSSFWRQILEIGDWNFQGERPVMDPPTLDIPKVFRNNEEALIHVEHSTCAFFHFYEKAERLSRFGIMTPEMELEMQEQFQGLTNSFASCEQAYQAMVALRVDHSLEKTPSGLMLSIHRILFTIYVSIMEQGNEVGIFDDHISSLREAVDLSEEYILLTNSLDLGDPLTGSRKNSPSQSGSPGMAALPSNRVMTPSFSLSLGVVPVLFVVATRCTEPSVRDKAIHLLRTCNRKEGFWDSQLSACIAARTIEIKADAARHFKAAATPEGLRGREVRDSDIKMKLEDIQYYPDNECVLHYSLIWEDEGEEDHMGLGLRQPGETMIRKRDFSERLAWGDQPTVAGNEHDYTSMMRNGLVSEEIRRPLQDWEKHGMVR